MPRFGTTFGGALRFENVSYRYADEDVISNLTLEVKSGEILCLLGESGCGKSTLLKIAAGLIRQDEGVLSLDSRILADDARFVLPESRGVGLVFQDYALFPHMSVLQNVMFGLRKVSKTEAKAQAELALQAVRLINFADALPNALSGGQQQRVALARALVPRPSVLLLDEPFSNLDRGMRNAVREETLRILKSIGATSIVVTHDAEEAMRIGDRIALVHQGRIEQIDTARDLYQKPKSLRVARFLGSLNEIQGMCMNGVMHTIIGDFPLVKQRKDGAAILAVRPENVEIEAPNIYPIKGRINGQFFLGSVDLLEVAVEGLEQKLLAYARPQMNFLIGQDISIRIAPLETLVFDNNLP